MKFEKICRTCLLEKNPLKSLFNACLPNMLMSCASIQVLEGDGLPHQICLQCLQMINRAYTFKQQCEKSDVALRQYLNDLEIQNVSLEQSNLMVVKDDQLLSTSEVLQQNSLFQEIFNDATTQSLVENFANQNASSVVDDLAETMHSLQTIAEQYLPETWHTDAQLMPCPSGPQEVFASSLNLNSSFKCQYCPEMFENEWILSEHLKIHTTENKYFCNICCKGFYTEDLLSKHLNDDHSFDNLNPIEPKELPKENVQCDICDRFFVNSKFLRKHLKEIHFNNQFPDDNEKKYICSICGRGYRQNKSLIVHLRTHTGDRPLKCEICGRSFGLASSLHKHRNIHSLEKKHECHMCGRKFNQSSNLTTHLKTHRGDKAFSCSICGKNVSSKANLNVHMRVHTGLKPFKCTHCPNSFATNGQLKKHMMCHTGAKPYHCWQCGKTFRRKETRDTHVRYHTGERPYNCNICSKKYIAASHLRVHMKSHSGEKVFECNICTKTFSDSRTLKSHIIIHTGQKPYSCEFCGHQFTQLGSLNAHVKNIHNLQ
ncbi:zinc finger protein OZF-like isoform X1 [Harmonia axyridis]|uniref:zinc finger protein OZF-like isoform X1 n=2 Tax=Harmonia axyridis TaxID=115357 RepID=UPI001E2759C5|nr:zinc finger protein OZF-like isoform X1 [Harmonia axyridis]